MANEKIFQSRIQLKHDIEENWSKATNFVPKVGEIIIYDIDENNSIARFKIGDGITNVNSLPFVSHHEVISYLPQELTEEQQMQARKNLGLYYMWNGPKLVSTLDASSGSWTEVTTEEFYELGFTTKVDVSDIFGGAYDVSLEFEVTQRRLASSYSPDGLTHDVRYFGDASKLPEEFATAVGLASSAEFENKYPGTDILFAIHQVIPTSEDVVVPPDTVYTYIGASTYPTHIYKTVKIYSPDRTTNNYEPVPEEYIPDTIARKEDVPEAQVQSDWNQNDENAIDYIKNRTHYKSGENNYLVEPTTFNMVYGDAYPEDPIVINPDDFAVGNILYVVWNDTIYETTVKYHNMAMYNYIGDTTNDGTSIPFSIMDVDGNGTLTITDYTNNYTGDINFALAKSLAQIKKIDVEYLPIDNNVSETGEGLLQNKTVANKLIEVKQDIDEDIDSIKNNIPYIETIPDRLSESSLENQLYYYGEISLSLDDLIGAVAFYNSAEEGYNEHVIRKEDVLQYDWGFYVQDAESQYGQNVKFKRICYVVNNAPVEFNDFTFDKNGLYLTYKYDYLSDRYSPFYISCGIHIYRNKINANHIPNEIDRRVSDIVSQIGCTKNVQLGHFYYDSTDDDQPEYVLCSSDTWTKDDIIGAVIDMTAKSNIFNHTYVIKESDITDYTWGFSFGLYGFVVNNGPATYKDVTYSENGLYLGFFIYSDSYAQATVYCNYGLSKVHQMDTIYLQTMTGATSEADGSTGIVPAPVTGDQDKFLKGDGTWANILSEETQVNWEQNDSTAFDYIKGRTHWVGNDINQIFSLTAPYVENYDNKKPNYKYIIEDEDIVSAFKEFCTNYNGQKIAINLNGHWQKCLIKNNATININYIDNQKEEGVTAYCAFTDADNITSMYCLVDSTIFKNDVIYINKKIFGLEETPDNLTFKFYDAMPSFKQLDSNYIPTATSLTYGGVKASLATEEYTQPVKLGEDGKLYISERHNSITLIDQENGFDYIVEMRNGNLVSSLRPFELMVTTSPIKTSYIEGEYFDPTDMIVAAVYDNGASKEITDYQYQTDHLITDIVEITITANILETEYNTTTSISVTTLDPTTYLADYTYTDNGDGTYTVTGWADTTRTDELIIPNNYFVRLEDTVNE